MGRSKDIAERPSMFHRRNESHAVTLAGMLGLFVVGGLAAGSGRSCDGMG